MVTVAEQVAQNAPRDPLSPLVPCTITAAMDSVSPDIVYSLPVR